MRAPPNRGQVAARAPGAPDRSGVDPPGPRLARRAARPGEV